MWSNAGNGRILGIKLVKIQEKMEWMFEVASTVLIRSHDVAREAGMPLQYAD